MGCKKKMASTKLEAATTMKYTKPSRRKTLTRFVACPNCEICRHFMKARTVRMVSTTKGDRKYR